MYKLMRHELLTQLAEEKLEDRSQQSTQEDIRTGYQKWIH
jgi:hypothetical protein